MALTTPEVRAVGTVASGTGAVEPGLPAGTEVGDLLIMVCEGENSGAFISAEGWTLVAQTFNEGTAGTGSQCVVLFRIATGSDPHKTATGPTDHQQARIIGIKKGTFSGTTVEEIFNTTATGTQTSTKSVSIPGSTTTIDQCLIVACDTGSLPDASSTTEFSGQTNASLTSLTERMDNATAEGNGGSLWCVTGVKEAKGAYSATTGTAVNAAVRCNISVAVTPGGYVFGKQPEMRRKTQSGSGTSNVKFSLPSTAEVGDLAMVFVETGGENTGASISGYSSITIRQGNTRIAVFYKVLESTAAIELEVNAANHHQYYAVCIKKGSFDSGTPINVSTTNTQASTKSVSITGATSTADNCLVIAASAGALPDAASSEDVKTPVNASVTELTTVVSQTTEAGDGGALFVVRGIKEAKGAYGTTTATATTEAERANTSFAIQPVQPKENSDSPSGTLTLTGSVTESKEGNDKPSGSLTLTGTKTESKGFSDSASGSLTLSGTKAEAWGASDAPSGSLTLSGVNVETFGHSDSATGTITAEGSSTDKYEASDKPSGSGHLEGSISTSTEGSDVVKGTLTLEGSVVEQGGIVYEDTVSGSLTLTGSISVEELLTVYNDSIAGSLVSSGTRTESWETTWKPIGTLHLAGVIKELYKRREFLADPSTYLTLAPAGSSLGLAGKTRSLTTAPNDTSLPLKDTKTELELDNG